jgi:hypothetical protein
LVNVNIFKLRIIFSFHSNLILSFHNNFNNFCRPVFRQNSQPREHIIPIRFEAEDKSKTKPIQRVPSITSPKTSSSNLCKTSSSNLSRQSTVDTDSNSSIVSLGEPIRKSPREVIIPIAVEGGGYVTPSNSALYRTK